MRNWANISYSGINGAFVCAVEVSMIILMNLNMFGDPSNLLLIYGLFKFKLHKSLALGHLYPAKHGCTLALLARLAECVTKTS